MKDDEILTINVSTLHEIMTIYLAGRPEIPFGAWQLSHDIIEQIRGHYPTGFKTTEQYYKQQK